MAAVSPRARSKPSSGKQAKSTARVLTRKSGTEGRNLGPNTASMNSGAEARRKAQVGTKTYARRDAASRKARATSPSRPARSSSPTWTISTSVVGV